MDVEKFHELLKEASEKGASDILITVGKAPTIVINNTHVESLLPPMLPQDTEDIFQILIGAHKERVHRFEKVNQIDFPYALPGVSRYRINAYTQRGSKAFVVRLIPNLIPNIYDLNLPQSVIDFCDRDHGLVIVTGPAGSGKSTTLAALIDKINAEKQYHIVTLEDPIEYMHSHKKSNVDQREIFSDVPSFNLGLKAALRQTCNVIVIGELREPENMKTALLAASKGVLVFATMHTFDTVEAINQFLSSVPENEAQLVASQLASVLVGVVAQQLLPRLDGHGMALAAEVLVAGTAVKSLVRGRDMVALRNEISVGGAKGMQTMIESLRKLEEARTISAEYYQKAIADGSNVSREKLYTGAVGNSNFNLNNKVKRVLS